MKELTDQGLVNLCLAGNKAAWAELVSRFSILINSIARRKLSLLNFPCSNEDIEEIFSNTVNSLLDKDYYLLRRYNSAYPLSVWIGVIASTQCNRFIRKKKISTVSLDEKTKTGTPIDILSETSNLPENNAEKKELEGNIKRAVSRLKSRDNLIVTLLFFEQMAYKDIAAALKIPFKSVSKAIFRAKNSLKKELKKEGIKDFMP